MSPESEPGTASGGDSDPVPVSDPPVRRSRLGVAAFTVSALAGFVLAVGSLLIWAEFRLGATSGGLVFTLHGTDTTQGKIVLAAGVAVVIGTLILRVGKTERGRPIAGVVILVAAILGGATTGYFAATAKTNFQDKALLKLAQKVSVDTGLSPAALAKHEKEVIAAGKAVETFSLGVGVWISVAAAIAAVVGGVLAFLWARKTKREGTEAPPTGDLQTG